jgi:hypothetical protein
MHLIAHHFWKDVRLLRWLLGLWLLIVTVDVVLAWLSVQSDYDRAHAAYQVDSSTIFYVAGSICWTLLLVRLVQSEPMSGTASFWRTRPTPPWVMMSSKVLFVALLLVVPSVLLHFLSVALYQLPPSDIRQIVVDVIVLDCMVVPVIVWMATQTRNLAQFWIAVCVLVVGFSVYVSLSVIHFTSSPAGFQLTAWRWMVGGCVFYGGILFSLLLQYALRKSRAAFWTGAICAALSILISMRLPFTPLFFYASHNRITEHDTTVPFEFDRSVSPGWSKGNLLGRSYDQLTVAVRPPTAESRGLPVVQSWWGDFVPEGGRKTTLNYSSHTLIIPPASLNWLPLMRTLRPDLNVVTTNFQDSQSLFLEVSGDDPGVIKGHPGTLHLGITGQLQSLHRCGEIALGGRRFARLPGRIIWITWAAIINDLPSVQMEATGYTKARNDPFGSFLFLMVNQSAKVGIIAERGSSEVEQSSFFGIGDWGRLSGSERIGCPPNILSSAAQDSLHGTRLEDWTIEVYEIAPGVPFTSSITVPQITL